MKTLNQIYNILLEMHMERVKKYEHISPSICATIIECFVKGKITDKERNLVIYHMTLQRPDKGINSEFISNTLYNEEGMEWWSDNRDFKEQVTTERIKFLSKMILITKEYNYGG